MKVDYEQLNMTTGKKQLGVFTYVKCGRVYMLK